MTALLVFSISTSVRQVRAEHASHSVADPGENRVVQDQIWFTPNIGSVDMLDLFESPEQAITINQRRVRLDLPGRPRPIHGPRQVYEWDKPNNIARRTLLDRREEATAPETDTGRPEGATS